MWQSIVRIGGVQERVPQLGHEYLRCSRGSQSLAEALSIRVNQVPHEWVTSAVVGDEDESLNDLFRQAGMLGDEPVCPLPHSAGVPRNQFNEQVVAIGKVAIDAGPRHRHLSSNIF